MGMLKKKNLRLIDWCLVAGLICFSPRASGSRGLLPAKLKELPSKLSVSETIRVRIFPHFRDYLPQGRDVDKERVGFQSASHCRLYRGLSHTSGGAPAKKGFFGVGTDFEFRYEDLKEPLWLDCPSSTKMMRSEKKVPSYRYLGNFYIHRIDSPDKGRYIEVVNVIHLEKYLEGVVPSEVYAHWPEEALKTQAVAARTYAFFHLFRARESGRPSFYDVDDTINYQVYTGIDRFHVRTSAAVRETRGEVIIFGNQVIQAYYHADSGGATANPMHVWNISAPYLKSMPDGTANQASAWRRSLSKRALGRNLRRLKLIGKNEPLVDLFVPAAGRTQSGRVKFLTVVVGVDKRKINISLATFQKFASGLPSTMFYIQQRRNQFRLVGLGFGHGVGLSQRGAKVLAKEQNWNYRRILTHYYPNTLLCQAEDIDGKDAIESCQDHLVPLDKRTVLAQQNRSSRL